MVNRAEPERTLGLLQADFVLNPLPLGLDERNSGMVSRSPLRIDRAKQHVVVRFLDRQLFEDTTVRSVTDQLLRLTEEITAGSLLVLDFSEVHSVSSNLLGRLILIHRRLENAGSRLVLCDLTEDVAAIFRGASLDRFFHIRHNREEALDSVLAGL